MSENYKNQSKTLGIILKITVPITGNYTVPLVSSDWMYPILAFSKIAELILYKEEIYILIRCIIFVVIV
jgi:hypothetical protein